MSGDAPHGYPGKDREGVHKPGPRRRPRTCGRAPPIQIGIAASAIRYCSGFAKENVT